MLPHVLRERRHKAVRAEAHRCIDAQLAARRGLKVRGQRLRRFHLGEHGLAALVKRAPGFGEALAARRTIDELHAIALLEQPHMLADGLRCHAERRAGRGERARFRRFDEDRHAGETIHD
jgi:hypothetical protein